jgi:hypothetical protein
VVAAFIHGVAADRVIGQGTGRTAASRPLLKLLRSFLSRQCMLPSRLCDPYRAAHPPSAAFESRRCPALNLRVPDSFRVLLALRSKSHLFLQGHGIRLQISASFTPNFSRNLQSGKSEVNSVDEKGAHSRISRRKAPLAGSAVHYRDGQVNR